ncbi:MAG: ABC transporter ATP-binding protein [Candidatus Bathyarchaeota archaeon]|nr:ABC transporter ATP-binding protein [Candidatus Bathyarchaeota archaeon]
MGMRGGGGGMGGGYHGIVAGDDDNSIRQIPDSALAIRMLKYVLRYKRRAAIMFVTVVLTTGLNLIPTLLYGTAIDKYIPNMDATGLTLIAIGYLLVILTTYGSQFTQNYLIEWLFGRMEYDMREDIFDHLQKLSINYFADKEPGNIVSRATNDIDKISELISSGVITAVADLLTIIGIIIIMFSLNLRLSLVSFAIIPVMLVWMIVWGKRVRTVYRETRKSIASVSAQMEESVSGIKEIQSFSKEDETKREFQNVNESNRMANTEAGRVMSAFYPTVTFFTAIGQALILYFGGADVIQHVITVGTLFIFMSYLTRFFQPIQELSNIWTSIQSAFAASERVFNIIDTTIDITDAPDAKPLGPIKGEIIYDQMTFGYEKDHPVLKDIELVIEPNTNVAFVGPTGVGKTTMINLLYRFYDPTEGRILVDGNDLRSVKIESLRTQMGIVLQDPFLFSGTIIDNIRYSRPKATDEDVIAVSKAIGIHDFIIRLPEGYQTDVMERGGRLSIGQRQLVSLARALLADPRILIMDEATSSIDAYTELIIQKAMDKILEGRTSIVIAHRLSTVRNADKIVVIEGGRIVEMGSHNKLLEKGNLYKKLYDMQFKTGAMEMAEPTLKK